MSYRECRLHLYDSWGIEADKLEEWKMEVYSKLENAEQSLNISDWFHTVFYCISMNNRRIEDVEITIITDLFQYVNPIIILTHCDQENASSINQIKSVIHQKIDSSIRIIEVNSVEKKSRKGTAMTYGREETFKNMFNILWEKILKKLPYIIVEELNKCLVSNLDYLCKLKNFNSKKLNQKNLFELIFKDERFINIIKQYYHDAILIYQYFIKIYYDATEINSYLNELENFLYHKLRHLTAKNLKFALLHDFSFKFIPVVGLFHKDIKYKLDYEFKKLKSDLVQEISNDLNEIAIKINRPLLALTLA